MRVTGLSCWVQHHQNTWFCLCKGYPSAFCLSTLVNCSNKTKLSERKIYVLENLCRAGGWWYLYFPVDREGWQGTYSKSHQGLWFSLAPPCLAVLWQLLPPEHKVKVDPARSQWQSARLGSCYWSLNLIPKKIYGDAALCRRQLINNTSRKRNSLWDRRAKTLQDVKAGWHPTGRVISSELGRFMEKASYTSHPGG